MRGGRTVQSTKANISPHSTASPATCRHRARCRPRRSSQPPWQNRPPAAKKNHGDVRPDDVIAQNAGVGIEQNRNQRQSRQGGEGPAPQQVGAVPPQKAHLNHGEQKHRHKQKLHVLPGGLIDGGENRRRGGPPAPVVDKVERRSQRPGEQKARQLPEKQTSAHTRLQNERLGEKNHRPIFSSFSRIMREMALPDPPGTENIPAARQELFAFFLKCAILP